MCVFLTIFQNNCIYPIIIKLRRVCFAVQFFQHLQIEIYSQPVSPAAAKSCCCASVRPLFSCAQIVIVIIVSIVVIVIIVSIVIICNCPQKILFVSYDNLF